VTPSRATRRPEGGSIVGGFLDLGRVVRGVVGLGGFFGSVLDLGRVVRVLDLGRVVRGVLRLGGVV